MWLNRKPYALEKTCWPTNLHLKVTLIDKLKKLMVAKNIQHFSHQSSTSQCSDICFVMAGACCLQHPSQATDTHWPVMLPVLPGAPITSSFRMMVPINTTKMEIVSVGRLPYGGWQLLNQIKTNTHGRRESKNGAGWGGWGWGCQQSLLRKALIWLLVFCQDFGGIVC